MRENDKGRKRNGRERNKGNREGDRAETRLMPFPLRGLGRLWRRLGEWKGVERGGGGGDEDRQFETSDGWLSTQLSHHPTTPCSQDGGFFSAGALVQRVSGGGGWGGGDPSVRCWCLRVCFASVKLAQQGGLVTQQGSRVLDWLWRGHRARGERANHPARLRCGRQLTDTCCQKPQ